MAIISNNITLKITINARFSIRVQATALEAPHEYQGRLLKLDVVKDALSVMIRDGNECEINVPESAPVFGRIQAVRQSMNGSETVQLWVATAQKSLARGNVL